MLKISAIDLFCGIGGLSYGLKEAGIPVVAGIDLDSTCKYAFEENVKAEFISKNIAEIKGANLKEKYWGGRNITKVLVGCAPCQPFSMHTNKNKDKDKSDKWFLLNEFKRLISEVDPDVVSMENVPNLANQIIFIDFVSFLSKLNYHVTYSIVYCPDYGIPQKRRRLVLLASKLGPIKLIQKSHSPSTYVTLKDAIGHLPLVKPGEQNASDPLHKARNLTEVNLKRISSSKPDGTWMDWDAGLLLPCHKRKTGKTYKSVYGRMSWDKPSSTITTQFYNLGTGRFGHPVQDRALTLREGALLQTFPLDYKFAENEEKTSMSQLGTHIGNAVPVRLGIVIGESIIAHLGGENG